MVDHTKGPKKEPGRKVKKTRSHISLNPNLSKAAEIMGQKTFGNKTAYLEHLILMDLKAHGFTVDDIDRLAAEWEEKQAASHEK